MEYNEAKGQEPIRENEKEPYELGMTWANNPAKDNNWPPYPERSPKTLGKLLPKDIPAFAAGVVAGIRAKRLKEYEEKIRLSENQIKSYEKLIAQGNASEPAQWEVVDTRRDESPDGYRPAGGDVTRRMIAPPGDDLQHQIDFARRMIEMDRTNMNQTSDKEVQWEKLAKDYQKEE